MVIETLFWFLSRVGKKKKKMRKTYIGTAQKIKFTIKDFIGKC